MYFCYKILVYIYCTIIKKEGKSEETKFLWSGEGVGESRSSIRKTAWMEAKTKNDICEEGIYIIQTEDIENTFAQIKYDKWGIKNVIYRNCCRDYCCFFLKSGNNTRKEVEETTEEAGTIKNVTDAKVILFLVGIMVLAEVGSSKMLMLGDVVFVVLILYLGYVLFKRLFMRWLYLNIFLIRRKLCLN